MFIIATIVTSMFAISLQYIFTRQMSEEHVVSKLTKATTDVSEYIQEVDLNAKSSARILSSISRTIDHDFSEEEIRTILIQVLKDNPLFYSIYFGNGQEDFYQIINLESSPIVRQRIEARADDRWVVIKINGPEHNRIRQTIYYTSDFEQTGVRTKKSNYFPTQRPWYQAASADDVYKTEPYLFKHLKITGQTYSLKTREAVLGIDIVLSSISSRITAAAMGLPTDAGVESFVFHRTGEIIASNQQGADEIQSVTKPLKLSPSEQDLVDRTPSLLVSNQLNWRPYDYARAGEPQGYSIALLNLLAKKTGLHFEFINGFSSDELIRKLNQNQLDIVHSLPELNLDSERARIFLFKEPLAMAFLGETAPDWYSSKVGVIDGHRFNASSVMGEVSPTVFSDGEDAYQALLKGDIQLLLDTRRTLEHLGQNSDVKFQFLPIQASAPFYLTLSEKHNRLEPLLARAIDSITPDELTKLSDAWFSQVKEHRVPYEGLDSLAGTGTIHKREVNGSSKFFYVEALGKNAQSNEEFLAVIVPEDVVMAQVYDRLYTSIGGTVVVLCLLLPVAWVFGNPIVKPIRQLQEETKKIKCRKFDDVQIVNSNIKEVWALSHSIHDMAREIKRHEKQQEAFVESFIKLIAQAIDDKSPYTAGHCNRVPELGMLLAEAAEKCDSGSLKDFSFANNQERREFRIAAWLHDCGKITTPEHIVDKGTKLEANYNRIHEVRMRFEVLWRDAEIEFLQSQLAGDLDKEQALQILRAKKAQLQEDFEFVATSNVGGEFMGKNQVERIKFISQITWQRNFDDRLGLSPFEELNKPACQRTLPATEKLLDDKPEHIQHRIRPLEFDPKFGIKMDVPEHQYNLGEVYNLSISRGTLTAEDRFKINEHIISGIKMLEALPFPPELSRVPRYASTHHETLKGTGYPRKLTAEDLSVPERILVIADIFEALTAADRPYKKAKPVSVAVDILYKMALDQHVDMELFLLFLQSGAYLEYANKFLPESQNDKVDITQYLTPEQVA
ncbi:transporter substrate-binding domain-containing protein [Vibrio coralliilyticus]|nr:HD domain-containing phosphohydrolase [Vibrio coralliilyticus]NOI27900.1 transporter substrate-binding domain-containing protein [Vibrio coralliilyticus]NOI49639.1 transporter substrate-binding domain-containing protein [Vibrio coralliilyticus]